MVVSTIEDKNSGFIFTRINITPQLIWDVWDSYDDNDEIQMAVEFEDGVYEAIYCSIDSFFSTLKENRNKKMLFFMGLMWGDDPRVKTEYIKRDTSK